MKIHLLRKDMYTVCGCWLAKLSYKDWIKMTRLIRRGVTCKTCLRSKI